MQSKVSSLLKAVRRGFLNGCSNMPVNLILKYLDLSAATAKGHMKRPCHGIRSTRTRTPVKTNDPHVQVEPVPVILQPVPIILPFPPKYQPLPPGPNLIADDKDQSIANIFCFGAFPNKQSGIVYHDNTGSFPFMSFNGSICFFVLYHYESNEILASPIASLEDFSIFKTYKQYFEELTQKGCNPKLNIMDNQATKHIKKFLTENDCKLQIIEPHNHCVNAAKHAIQTFKAAFIAPLVTTDSNFPLQLWDRLTPQVEDTLM
jgi:hypothetical protein